MAEIVTRRPGEDFDYTQRRWAQHPPLGRLPTKGSGKSKAPLYQVDLAICRIGFQKLYLDDVLAGRTPGPTTTISFPSGIIIPAKSSPELAEAHVEYEAFMREAREAVEEKASDPETGESAPVAGPSGS